MRWRLLLVVLLWVGCGHGSSGGPPGDGGKEDAGGAPPDAGLPLASLRASCAFGRGDLATKTLADWMPDGGIPIDHVVLVMLENRSFDHYFSSLTVPGQTVDGAAAGADNPDPAHPGQMVSRFHQTDPCFDGVNNGWDVAHISVDDGGMDGFARGNATPDDPSGRSSMGYYDESDLPYFYALARAFAISDRNFCSVQGPTYPNRLFYMTGTSYGITDDSLPPQTDGAGHLLPNLFTQLDHAGVSWSVYAQDIPTPYLLGSTSADSAHFFPFSQFAVDAAAGTLPSVSLVEASVTRGVLNTDGEPPADFQFSQRWLSDVVATLMASPAWPSSALFLTFDEGGGLYDHVPPPPACVPDAYPPLIPQGGVPGTFDHLGIRVPLVVVSPYAKRHYVSHVVTDHTSLLRFVEARFGLPAFTRRDANAVPPFDLFDFDHPDTSVPSLPDAGVNEDAANSCVKEHPGN